jgi:hypothetical protein
MLCSIWSWVLRSWQCEYPHSSGATKVTYFIWHPSMVALGAISSKLSLTSRDNPVRCVRGDMLDDPDSLNMSCNAMSATVGMHSVDKICFLNLYDYFSELIWKLHASLFMHKHPIVADIKIKTFSTLAARRTF